MFFFSGCWFKISIRKTLLATRKHCLFCQITFPYDFSCQSLMNCCRKQWFTLFINKDFRILADIRKWFVALASLKMAVTKIMLKILQEGRSKMRDIRMFLMVWDPTKPARTRNKIVHSVPFLNGNFQFSLSIELTVHGLLWDRILKLNKSCGVALHFWPLSRIFFFKELMSQILSSVVSNPVFCNSSCNLMAIGTVSSRSSSRNISYIPVFTLYRTGLAPTLWNFAPSTIRRYYEALMTRSGARLVHAPHTQKQLQEICANRTDWQFL